jgi:hypothetical protein
MSESFPFTLDDIKGWIIRRKDGVVVSYRLTTQEQASKNTAATKVNTAAPKATSNWSGNFFTNYGKGFSDLCEHTPSTKNPPIFEKDGIALYIADYAGARKSYQQFDVAIDGGGVLSVSGEHDLPYLYGDPFFKKLERHVNKSPYKVEGNTRIIKVRWFDRAAPPLAPGFWPDLLKLLRTLQKDKGETLNVLTICQGGHGRSGSAMASLMMCLEESYTPLDALTHIRALHCPRAIESKEQHEYLNLLGALLNRETDALDAEDVPSFKARLQAEPQFAQTYKDRVAAGKGATKESREAGYL